MGLFSRKTTETAPAEPRIPATEEVYAAGRALQLRDDSGPAERLVAEAGPHSQVVAMQILSAAAEYDPYDR